MPNNILDYDLNFDDHLSCKPFMQHERSPCHYPDPLTPRTIYANPASQPRLFDAEDPILKYGTTTPGSSFGTYPTDIKAEQAFYLQADLFETPGRKASIDAEILDYDATLPHTNPQHTTARSINSPYNEPASAVYNFREVDAYTGQYGAPSHEFYFPKYNTAFPWQFGDDDNDRPSLSPRHLLAEGTVEDNLHAPEYHPGTSSHYTRSSRRQGNDTQARRGVISGRIRKPSDNKGRVPRPGFRDPALELDKPYACSIGDCTQRFQRKEHRKRHWIVTHKINVGVNPQVPWCDYCQKAFPGRRDNLMVHTLLHTHTDAERAAMGKTGKRRAAYHPEAKAVYEALVAANPRKRSAPKRVNVEAQATRRRV